MKPSITLLFIFSLYYSSFANLIEDYHYILQWPGSACAAKDGCCYPKSQRPPADFTIARLIPFFYPNGTIPTNCNPNSHLDISKVSDLVPKLERYWPSLACPRRDSKALWSENWQKYGTCQDFDQHQYFSAALNMKNKINLLHAFKNAGIQPNGTFYSYDAIYTAVADTIFTYSFVLECNRDKSGNFQLYQVQFCTNGFVIYDCPSLPESNCPKRIRLPSI